MVGHVGHISNSLRRGGTRDPGSRGRVFGAARCVKSGHCAPPSVPGWPRRPWVREARQAGSSAGKSGTRDPAGRSREAHSDRRGDAHRPRRRFCPRASWPVPVLGRTTRSASEAPAAARPSAEPGPAHPSSILRWYPFPRPPLYQARNARCRRQPLGRLPESFLSRSYGSLGNLGVPRSTPPKCFQSSRLKDKGTLSLMVSSSSRTRYWYSRAVSDIGEGATRRTR